MLYGGSDSFFEKARAARTGDCVRGGSIPLDQCLKRRQAYSSRVSARLGQGAASRFREVRPHTSTEGQQRFKRQRAYRNGGHVSAKGRQPPPVSGWRVATLLFRCLSIKEVTATLHYNNRNNNTKIPRKEPTPPLLQALFNV
jgi:hypothetical protein